MNASNHRRLPILATIVGVALTLITAVVISQQLQDGTTASDDSSAATGYQGYARLGMGQLILADLTEQEVEQTKFGWWFTWGETNNDQNNVLPAGTKFIAVAGNGDKYAAPCTTNSTGNGFVDFMRKLPDRTIVMVGNELGNDDLNDPVSYVERYIKTYDCIKTTNPTLQVYVGGHVSPNNGLGWIMGSWIYKADPTNQNRWHYETKRINSLEYMSIVVSDYHAKCLGSSGSQGGSYSAFCNKYGNTFPADGFTTHAYPGVATRPAAHASAGKPAGELYSWYESDGYKNEVFDFRTWMKENGYQNKPLIVKEYGILHDNQPYQNGALSAMREASQYYATTKDTALGNPNDDYRLVQQFAWYTIYVNASSTQPPKWPGTVFFQCPNFDCTPSNRTNITPLWQGWKDFVSIDLAGYDSKQPNLPSASFTQSGANTVVTYSATDTKPNGSAGQINSYIVSVGTAPGKADIVAWSNVGKSTSRQFTSAQVQNHYVNIIAIDDGYNESEIKSLHITNTPASPIPTATTNPTLVPTVPGKAVICGAMDNDNNGTFNLVDFNAFSQIYQGTCTNVSIIASTCGAQDTNQDRKINIIDFYSFTQRYRKASCSLATDQ